MVTVSGPAKEQRCLADPDAPYWTMNDIAAYWTRIGPRKVDPGTVRDYRYTSTHLNPGQAAPLPPPDDMIGIHPVWYPATIINFVRPGQGTGGGPRPLSG